MKFITEQHWEETKKRYLAWWANGLYERPLLYVVAKKQPSGEFEDPGEAADPKEARTNIDYVIKRARYNADTHAWLGDTYPNFSLNLGPGTLALYLGSEPRFAWDTVWFDPCMEDIHEGWRFRADPNAKWFKYEMAALKYAMARMGDEFFYGFPDIVENIDILSAMRDPQELCVDMMDEPEEVKRRIAQIDVLYEYYYNLFYDVIKQPDGSSFYSAFRVWGPGRTAKIQCDFSALISVNHFREFVLPSLVRQCDYIDNTVYHLDGPQAVKHVPALMEIKKLKALQFTCGEMRPDGTNEEWWPVYDQARKAGKALWVQVYDEGPDQWMKNIDRFIKRYGANGMYFRMPEFENEEIANEFIRKAELDWH